MTRGSIALSGRRSVEYWETGSPDGPVVLYCHGTPGSALELRLAQPALQRNEVRLRFIGFNRPGYGASPFFRYEGFLSWVEIADEAADRLGLERFAVLGASGGSPFALACARSLDDRVDRVGIVAGVAPPDIPGMDRSAALIDESARPVIRTLRYGSLHVALRLGLTRLLVRRLISALGPTDRKAMSEPSATKFFEAVVGDAFAQWGRAAALEAGFLMRPWDFELSDVSQEVRIWHGADDTRIPVEVAPALADRLPHAACDIWAHQGHFSWALSDDIVDVAAFLSGARD